MNVTSNQSGVGDRLELICLMTAFMEGLDHAPTRAEVRAFVDTLSEEQLRRYFTSMLKDATLGLMPGKGKRAHA